jgi:hypothetical protein
MRLLAAKSGAQISNFKANANLVPFVPCSISEIVIIILRYYNFSGMLSVLRQGRFYLYCFSSARFEAAELPFTSCKPFLS